MSKLTNEEIGKVIQFGGVERRGPAGGDCLHALARVAESAGTR
jgi:hypothetical protein